MTYIFWQNIISIHQSAFLKSLSEDHKVILVVEKTLSRTRKKTGWEIPDIGNVEIIISPSSTESKKLLRKYSDAYHILSGLGAYKLPTAILKLCKKYNFSNVIIITESYESFGIKGLIRKAKYNFFSKKYQNIIKGVFVTGMPARVCFESLKFSKDIIYDWGYFTEFTGQKNSKISDNTLPKLLFVGSIDKNKNILNKIPIILKHKSLFSKFYIIGSGPLVAKLEELILEIKSIEYKGVVKNSDIQDLMKECDLLVLPSLYDGWGAVINEALSNGMRVLCSDNCGASILLDGTTRGSVFSHTKNNFEEHLVKLLKQGVVSEKERNKIIDWSKNHISGSIAASYFNDCISYLRNKKQHKPKAPWLQ